MMNLTDRLEALAESDAPPMTLDIDRAVKTGRRRRQRRGAAVAGVATLAVTGTLIASTLVNSVDNRPAPATPRTVDAPLVTGATFGWLPAGLTSTEFGVGAHGDYAKVTSATASESAMMWLSVHPAGKVPDVEIGGRKLAPIPAPPVNGRTAYWATAKKSDPLNGGDAVLLWQAADGRWAQLHAYYLGHLDGEPKALLHRVATGADLTERAQPIPVRITGMPREYRLGEVTFTRPMMRFEGTGRWYLKLFYDSAEKPFFTILVSPAGTRKLDRKVKVVGEETRTCDVAKGVEVCVVTESANSKAVQNLGGVHGILRRFVPLGMDESRWETGQR